MGFDFNEARAIFEQAKQAGLIREAGSPEPKEKKAAERPSGEQAGEGLPEWLKRGLSEPATEA